MSPSGSVLSPTISCTCRRCHACRSHVRKADHRCPFPARGELTAAEQVADEILEISADGSIVLGWAVIKEAVRRLREQYANAAEVSQSWLDAGLIPASAQYYVRGLVGLRRAESGDLAAGRAALDALARDGFAGLCAPTDWGRLQELMVLTELCVAVDARDHAPAIFELFAPWEHHQVHMSLPEDCGPATLFLGRLAMLMDQMDDAVGFLRRRARRDHSARVPG